MTKRKLALLIIFFICTIVLLAGAFINHFPLVYPDTGSYIYYAFNRGIPYDRPVTYSLFIKIFSLGRSLWYVVLMQCFILSYLLIRCFQKFLNQAVNIYFIIVIVIVAFFTGLIWYSGQIMADIFTPITIMVLLLLLLQRFSIAESALLAFIYMVSAMMHNSNLVSTILFCALFFFLVRITKWISTEGISWRRWLLISMMVIFPWVLLPSIHFFIGNEFSISKGKSVFIMGHLIENGILHEYLAENCSEKNYKLCTYIDSLPCGASYFLWNPKSPLAKTGGWEANDEEFKEIETDIFTSPKYLLRVFEMGTVYTFIQLFDNDVGGLESNLENTTPFSAIRQYFPYEFEPYTCSRQNSNGLHFEALNRRQDLALIISTLIIFVFLFKSPGTQKQSSLKAFAVGVLIFCTCNAAVCANLANSLHRLEGRVSWLLVFVACLIVLEKKETWFPWLFNQKTE